MTFKSFRVKASIRQEALKALLLFPLAIMTATYYGKIDYHDERFANWDLVSYIKIASSSPAIAQDVAKPFAYRLLGPYVVGALPVRLDLGFFAVSLLLSTCLIFTSYRLFLQFGLSEGFAAFSTTLFVLNKHLFGFTLWNYFQVNDLISLNLIVLMFSAILRKRWGTLSLMLAVGTMSKETTLLMIPIPFAFLFETQDLSVKWKAVAAAVLPGVLLFCLLRAIIPTGGGQPLREAFLMHWAKALSAETISRQFFNAFLPLSFIPVVLWRNTIAFFRERQHLLLYFVLVVLSTLFGSNNERLMAPTFVVFYLLVGYLLSQVSLTKISAGLILTATFVASFHHLYGRWPLPNVV